MIKIIQNKDNQKWTLEDYKKLFDRVDSVLSKRKTLHERYSRGSTDSSTMFNGNLMNVPFEKFIVDLAAGYLAGVPDYTVKVPDEVSTRIRKTIFGKEEMTDEIMDEMKAVIDYVTDYNDDPEEVYKLFKDLLLYGACYEVLYESTTNELVYNNFDALNTVAIWDTSVPSNLLAIVSRYSDKDKDNKSFDLFRVVDKEGVRVFDRSDNKEIKENVEMAETKVWNDVPGFAIETDFSIIENSEDIIKTYESLLSNVKETYKYNAEDCKLKISGYKAQNRLTIPDPNDPKKTIINPDRKLEDEYVLQGRTFYTEEGGDAEWLTKPVDAAGVTTLLKYYVDSIFQLCGIPNTADLAFNSADLNASAIDRKFYVMNMKTQDVVALLKKGLLRRFELIFGRINMKFSKKYDFRYIQIDIPKNLPSMTDENIDQMIKLNGILSEETIIEKLGYDYETEKARKEDDLGGNGDMDKDDEDVKNPDEQNPEGTEDNSSKSKEGNEISEEESDSDKDGKGGSSKVQ